MEPAFEASKISYKKLLEVFWRQIDSTDDGGQFADRGPRGISGRKLWNGEQHIQFDSICDMMQSEG